MWVLLNLNRQQWGDEFYETEAEAHAELKSFWKGVSGVNRVQQLRVNKQLPVNIFQRGRNQPLQTQQIPPKSAVEHAPSPRPGANPGGLSLIRQMRAAA